MGGVTTPRKKAKTTKAKAKQGAKPAVNPEPIAGEIVPAEQALETQTEQPEQAVALFDKDQTLAVVGGISTMQLKQALETQTEQRALIKEFIQHHLVEGTDYGRIHVVKDCQEKYSCKKDYHFSKSTLFKPGQEKIFSLFSISDQLEKDGEAYEMLGQMPGLVAYKCTLYRSGQEVGHGRGAAVLGDQRRDANATIKIAEKRARMDACLSLGFSEYFAQDLDDADYRAAQQQANERAAAEAAARDKDDLGLLRRDAALAMNDDERKLLFQTIKGAGYEQPDQMLELLALNGIADARGMTSGQARSFIRLLRTGDYKPVPVPPPADSLSDVELQEISGSEAGDAPVASKTAFVDAEMIVDDELKTHIMDSFPSLGLNSMGKQWFFNKVSGKPFIQFDKLNEAGWRKAYHLLDAILTQDVAVPDRYILGLVVNPEPGVVRDPSLPESEQAA